MKRIIIGICIGSLLLAFTACKKQQEATTQATTAATTQTTTKATTQATTQQLTKAPETPATPEPESYKIYIDNTNQKAWTTLLWNPVADADGYEVQYGLQEDEAMMRQQQWEEEVRTVEGGDKTEDVTVMTYGTGFDIDMARVRAYTEENGEKVYSDWSEAILLDIENKVMM